MAVKRPTQVPIRMRKRKGTSNVDFSRAVKAVLNKFYFHVEKKKTVLQKSSLAANFEQLNSDVQRSKAIVIYCRLVIHHPYMSTND